MKILIVGGTGFLGSTIVQKLITRNHNVTILTRNPYKAMPFDKSKVTFLTGDILSIDRISISEKFDVLVYTAMVPFKPGRVSTMKFKKMEVLTKLYFQNIIELAKTLNCPLILTSGASFDTKENEIADENWPIARKGMAALGKCYDEIISRVKSKKTIPLIEMLPAQIYGKGGLFLRTINMAKAGKVVILGKGKNRLPRIHVEDCATAYVLAIEKLPIGEKFILCDNLSCTVEDFMTYLAEVYNANTILHIPEFILRIATGKYIYQTVTLNTVVSNKKIKEKLGWEPAYPSYKEGLLSLK
ncbi:MAG: NAD(P)-dependent oxidoreductase [Spirochaetales bacterium]|nr:NAD(P)-dependent oxidoreductase [Spirochaetales bacterium]